MLVTILRFYSRAIEIGTTRGKATGFVLLSFCLGHMHNAGLHIWNTFQRYFNEFRKYTVELEDPVIMADNGIVDLGANKA